MEEASRLAGAHDGAPTEHADTDEQQRHDRERDLERAALGDDADGHPDPDRQQPCGNRARPRQRRTSEARDQPGDREAYDEGPPHPEEPDGAGILVMAPP